MSTSRGHIIDGAGYAARLRERLKAHVADLKAAHGLVPCLVVVIVGEDPASQVYVRNKGEQTQAIGMESRTIKLPDTTSEDELLTLIAELNHEQAVNGILVQLPLPKHMSSLKVIDAIDPDKDVDGFHVSNAGKLAVGLDGIVPCTPLGSLMLLKDAMTTYGDSFAGKTAVIVGRSNIVGKPMAQLLLAQDCTVTIAHSKTRDLASVCRSADILVAAVGRPNFVQGDWVKDGAYVIDVGINRITVDTAEGPKNKLVGDVDFEAAKAHALAITPVPKGVGPMTIACLLNNTIKAFCLQNNLPVPEGV
ncbi:bifunctional methylenetetrahydrofolate dehydrogenase/methenyltetrahydrofolate cyclohydrolase FolD [Asticcacaulis sp. EMRT-3]|uniref:bifunctional 5,10-methylenetetrahydrofolate dehydrogenase/5,10-methenyltetrahydrofolate cyclohydrolase n=1 Tax=Asticcacaulis sp. EMRT-3 TaxID=3040349 RepID=UPI0024AF9F23|nr:bifunctional methylenetetrahydrofolate dehydrogenase/methenyltetrahydrofolate cyclohydrolase FolD [Asticcacaulis sp. EMRT-3]MDI7774316.1 bifunctional methylenetetrahydrofolate dehydrogenase/methenyltetrahydrofolate cyclohydrolase FolD [Asticcacaulis sp. EMRT-3]